MKLFGDGEKALGRALQSRFSGGEDWNNEQYNKLYDQAQQLPESPERQRLFRRMSELVNAYAPWMYNAYRYENILVQPWVQGYKHTVYEQHPWLYYDIDLARRNAASK